MRSWSACSNASMPLARPRAAAADRLRGMPLLPAGWYAGGRRACCAMPPPAWLYRRQSMWLSCYRDGQWRNNQLLASAATLDACRASKASMLLQSETSQRTICCMGTARRAGRRRASAGAVAPCPWCRRPVRRPLRTCIASACTLSGAQRHRRSVRTPSCWNPTGHKLASDLNGCEAAATAARKRLDQYVLSQVLATSVTLSRGCLADGVRQDLRRQGPAIRS